MIFIAARLTPEHRLRPAVIRRHKTAFRTGLRGIVRRDKLQDTASPGQLVCQLPAELVPPLVQNSLVQPGFLAHLTTRIFLGAFSRGAQVSHLQVLHDYDRVVFADLSGDLVQVVLAGVGDADMQPRDLLFLLAPVFRKPILSGKPALFPGQLLFQPAETVERLIDFAIREGGEPGDAQVYPYSGTGISGVSAATAGLCGTKPWRCSWAGWQAGPRS